MKEKFRDLPPLPAMEALGIGKFPSSSILYRFWDLKDFWALLYRGSKHQVGHFPEKNFIKKYENESVF